MAENKMHTKQNSGIKSTICGWFSGRGRDMQNDPTLLQHDWEWAQTSQRQARSSYFPKANGVASSTDLSQKKKRSDRHKMNEISNLGQHLERTSNTTKGTTESRSVTQEICNKNNVTELNVPWQQKFKSSVKVYDRNQHQRNLHQRDRSNCNQCYPGRPTRIPVINCLPAKQEISSQIGTQTGPEVSANNQRQKWKTQTTRSTTKETAHIKNFSSKYGIQDNNSNKSIQFKHPQGREEPVVGHYLRTVSEIESELKNSAVRYSQQKSGTSEVSSRDPEKEMELNRTGSQVNPQILPSTAERHLETNLDGHPANTPLDLSKKATGKEYIHDQTPIQSNFEDQRKAPPREEKITSTQNDKQFKYNDGNHQIQYVDQKALTYPQTGPLTQVETEISETGTTHHEKNANYETPGFNTKEDDADEKNSSAKMDDSEVSKKIGVIRDNSKILLGYINNFRGDSSEYYFIDENLTRFLLKLDKLPVEHSDKLRLERRAAIKYIYDLQNKLEENLRNRTKMGRLAVSQI